MTRDSMWRIFRSFLQFVAGGGLGIIIVQVVKDLPDQYDPYVVILGAFLAMAAQNIGETLTGSKWIGPQVVSTASAEKAVEKAFTAVPGVDPMPTVKS